ncbi:hypothetical protein C2845_PM06G25120 [Panicum miliaceum]|uniref:F-box domain-containing protein n=1 Tax=Panicum miliaceum TaxID=4540 RepID=A0A3L6RF96_PANMI|nr:hypothetical protein C2845_PM06G25120 [Panicum miliaceum]
MAPGPALPDEVVEEVVLRFPPDDPACLIRAALVCFSWCRLISVPGFRRRIRELHPTAPVMGALLNLCDPDAFKRSFLPKMPWEPDPYQRRTWNAAVICARGGSDHLDCRRGPFLVVYVRTGHEETFARVYSSEDNAWSEPSDKFRYLTSNSHFSRLLIQFAILSKYNSPRANSFDPTDFPLFSISLFSVYSSNEHTNLPLIFYRLDPSIEPCRPASRSYLLLNSPCRSLSLAPIARRRAAQCQLPGRCGHAAAAGQPRDAQPPRRQRQRRASRRPDVRGQAANARPVQECRPAGLPRRRRGAGGARSGGGGGSGFAELDALDLSGNKIFSDGNLRWMVGAGVGAVRRLVQLQARPRGRGRGRVAVARLRGQR